MIPRAEQPRAESITVGRCDADVATTSSLQLGPGSCVRSNAGLLARIFAGPEAVDDQSRSRGSHARRADYVWNTIATATWSPSAISTYEREK